jgi:hypothetical protein
MKDKEEIEYVKEKLKEKRRKGEKENKEVI